MSFLKTDRPSMFDRASAPPAEGTTALPNGGALSRLFGDTTDTTDTADADERDDEGIEAHALRVLSDAEQSFKQRAQKEADRFDLVTDTEYWIAAGFQSRRQKDAFLAALRERFSLPGDDDKYIDGWELAKALGIALPREDVPYNTGKVDRRWLELTR